MSVILDPTFTSEDHRYMDNAGNVVPSVTQLIGQYWPIDTSNYQKSGTDRGTMVHAHTQALDGGLFDMRHFEGDEHEGYLKAWSDFKAAYVDKLLWVEQKFIVEEFGYAGTVDRIFESTSSEIVLADIKTGQEEPWHELQQGSYSLAAFMAGIPVDKIVTVLLRPNGKYKVVPNDLQQALLAWKSLIAWHNYRTAKKRRKNP